MEPEFQEEQFEQAAKSVPPDEMLSSKDPKEERDGAQGDPRKRVLGCESKMCRLWVRSKAGHWRNQLGVWWSTRRKSKPRKGWENVHRQKGGARGLSRQSHEGSPQQNAHRRSDMTRLTFQKNHLASDLNIECWDKGRL